VSTGAQYIQHNLFCSRWNVHCKLVNIGALADEIIMQLPFDKCMGMNVWVILQMYFYVLFKCILLCLVGRRLFDCVTLCNFKLWVAGLWGHYWFIIKGVIYRWHYWSTKIKYSLMPFKKMDFLSWLSTYCFYCILFLLCIIIICIVSLFILVAVKQKFIARTVFLKPCLTVCVQRFGNWENFHCISEDILWSWKFGASFEHVICGRGKWLVYHF